MTEVKNTRIKWDKGIEHRYFCYWKGGFWVRGGMSLYVRLKIIVRNAGLVEWDGKIPRACELIP